MSSEQNYRVAEGTYHGFLGLMKWGALAAVLVAALVVLLIAK